MFEIPQMKTLKLDSCKQNISILLKITNEIISKMGNIQNSKKN
jgi:hypothetical protein